MSNAAGFAALDAMIARVRQIPELARQAAPDVATEVERVIVESISRGTGPDGKAWQKTKTGGRPLANAAKAVTARAIGTVVHVEVTGPEARHHSGTARGNVRRQIIPTRFIPDPMLKAIRDVFSRRFSKLMGAR